MGAAPESRQQLTQDDRAQIDLIPATQSAQAAYTHPLYLIEGRQLYGLRKVHPNFIRGALATVTVEHGIPTLYTLGPEDTAELLFLIARRAQRGEVWSPAGQVMEGLPARGIPESSRSW